MRSRVGVVGAYALALAAPATVLGVFFLWPLVTMIGLGLAPEGRLDLGAFGEVLARPRTQRVLLQTLALAAAATVSSALVGIPLAHILYRRRFRGRGVLRLLVVLPFVMPSVVVGFAFTTLLRSGGPLGFLGLDGTPVAIVLAMVFFNVAVFARTVGGASEALDSRMEDAARVLGATPWTTYRTVTLPRLLPAIAGAASIVFLFCATAFGIVLVLGGGRIGTIETEIYFQTVQFLDLPAASVLSLVQIVVVMVLLVLAGRTRRSRPDRHAGAAIVPRATRRDHGLIAYAVLVAGLLLVPITALVIRSLSTTSGWGFDHYLALATTGERNSLRITVVEALVNSLQIAVTAMVISVTLGVLVALVLTRRPRSGWGRRVIGLVDHAVMLPLGVSAVTVGLGILITLDEAPFDLRASWIIVPVAQALVALPLVVRSIVPVLSSIEPRLREGLATLGAPPWRAFLDVDMRMALRPILAASALALAACLGEFGATVFLARPEYATLPVVIYRLLGTPGTGNLGMAAAASVLLALLTVGIMALLERSRVGRAAAF